MLREASCIPQHAVARHDGLRARPPEMADPIEDCPPILLPRVHGRFKRSNYPDANRWSRMCVVRCDPLQEPMLYTIRADYNPKLMVQA